jgi:hypothetical protein
MATMSCAMRRVMGVLVAAAGFVAVMFVGGTMGGCSSMPPETGPTMGVRNDSDAPLRATFWIGDRDEQRPGAKADMQPQETLEIPPFGTKQFRLGSFSGYDSPSESFVRVQIQTVGPTFQTQGQYWYELNPPSPYTIRVYGKKTDLKFERVGGGTMAAVPPGLWFMNATAATTTATNPSATGAKPMIKRVDAQTPVAAASAGTTATKPRTNATGKPPVRRVPAQTTGVPTE